MQTSTTTHAKSSSALPADRCTNTQRSAMHTNLPVTSSHIIPQLHHNLMGIGSLCDHDCRVVFEKNFLQFIRRTTTSSFADGESQRAQCCGDLPSAQNTNRSPRRIFHRSNSTKRTQHTQRIRPTLLLAHMCRISRVLYLDRGHQSWQLCLLAGPYLCKRDKIISCLGRFLERTHDSVQTGFTLHQSQTSPQGSSP